MGTRDQSQEATSQGRLGHQNVVGRGGGAWTHSRVLQEETVGEEGDHSKLKGPRLPDQGPGQVGSPWPSLVVPGPSHDPPGRSSLSRVPEPLPSLGSTAVCEVVTVGRGQWQGRMPDLTGLASCASWDNTLVCVLWNLAPPMLASSDRLSSWICPELWQDFSSGNTAMEGHCLPLPSPPMPSHVPCAPTGLPAPSAIRGGDGATGFVLVPPEPRRAPPTWAL